MAKTYFLVLANSHGGSDSGAKPLTIIKIYKYKISISKYHNIMSTRYINMLYLNK